MSPLSPSRRRAEAFDALVRGTGEHAGPESTDLLQVVAALRTAAAAPVAARPDFVSSLREQLMTAAATELAPLPADGSAADRLTAPTRRPARDRRIAAAVGGLAIVGASTSMAVAAQSALPGDVLYPLKRVIENAHTTVSLGEDQKGQTLLANAAGRLDEVDQLTRSGDADPATVAATLADFSAQSAEAAQLLLADYQQNGHASSVVELRAFAASSLATLDQMAAGIPASARSALVGAANTLAGIDAAAHRACPTCEGAGISRFPTWMLTSAVEVGRLVDGPKVTQPASVTTVRPGHRKPSASASPSASTAPLLPAGPVIAQPDGGSSSAPQQSDGGDPLTQLGTAVLGGTSSNGTTAGGGTGASSGPSTGAGTSTDVSGGDLTGLVDGVTGILGGGGGASK